ncbi:hypothetical protein HUW63_37225, partial [Myxococcus sp. AM001]|nr:hypothetical protein [Myxococcus sp. AM001]
PLFQVLFALQNAPLPKLRLPELGLEVLEADTGTAKFDLSLLMKEQAGGLAASFEYSTDLFDPDTVARLATHYETLLGNALRQPQLPIGRLKLEVPQDGTAGRRSTG